MNKKFFKSKKIPNKPSYCKLSSYKEGLQKMQDLEKIISEVEMREVSDIDDGRLADLYNLNFELGEVVKWFYVKEAMTLSDKVKLLRRSAKAKSILWEEIKKRPDLSPVWE